MDPPTQQIPTHKFHISISKKIIVLIKLEIKLDMMVVNPITTRANNYTKCGVQLHQLLCLENYKTKCLRNLVQVPSNPAVRERREAIFVFFFINHTLYNVCNKGYYGRW